MTRRSLVALGAILITFADSVFDGGDAARLNTSRVTVTVLSVLGGLSKQTKYTNSVRTTTPFVATARIDDVATTEHGLRPGAIIEIAYDVNVDSRWPQRVESALRDGQSVTLTIFGGSDGRFQWLRGTRR